jgi:geranyl-CoA carboxylase alpha subunit
VVRFHKILIANRGEIACRVARSAKALGYPTVAVYSDADKDALHVRSADEAVHIGPSSPRESYLNIAAILDAARRTGAGAIHPGYGFLAENADFASACEEAGVVFIGPAPAVIRKMGDKAAAKALMRDAGVPCVPGYLGEDQSDGRLAAEAHRLGFPLLIKAVGGGGGRGIRAVDNAADLAGLLEAARREAKSAFGDDRLMLEKLILHPRHLEVQVFGDSFGAIVHLFERDCTTQRRRQKIIEEAPSPVLTTALRQTLTGYAVQAARAAGYRNAGTVEFIADANLNIYFLEMNTRLQVEHPVTEMVTGIDLVEWQIRIAAGEPLPLSQDQIALNGHAIEARLCAEDPYSNFEPQSGRVLHYAVQTGAGIRVETGIEQGSVVSPFYDSMVSKVIAHGRNRNEAIRRLAYALDGSPVLGLATNQQFLAALLRTEDFETAQLATDTLDRWAAEKAPLLVRPEPPFSIWALAAALFSERGGRGEWFWSGSALDFSIELDCRGTRRHLRSRRDKGGTITTQCGADAATLSLGRIAGAEVPFEDNGVRRIAHAVWGSNTLYLSVGGLSFIFEEVVARAEDEESKDGRAIVSPVSGVLVRLLAENGQRVEAGETLALIEAMKMETRITALAAGRICGVHASAGVQVASGALLFEIEPEDEKAHV